MPKNCCQSRFTNTRAVSGLSRETSPAAQVEPRKSLRGRRGAGGQKARQGGLHDFAALIQPVAARQDPHDAGLAGNGDQALGQRIIIVGRSPPRRRKLRAQVDQGWRVGFEVIGELCLLCVVSLAWLELDDVDNLFGGATAQTGGKGLAAVMAHRRNLPSTWLSPCRCSSVKVSVIGSPPSACPASGLSNS